MGYDRYIRLAVDTLTHAVMDANLLFANTKKAFAIRERYSRGEIRPACCECGQPLHIATSKFDRLFFRHGKGAEPCILKDAQFTGTELAAYNAVLHGKESERHKTLKYNMAELLRATPGVTENSVFADTQFLFHGKEKRKPDVYCKYKGMEMVFEIQLSALSQRYLLDRHDFYLKKGIYLVWILDAFDVLGQSHTERDVKYLSSYQNFFKLDETSTKFRLICTYKSPLITEKNKLISPWQSRSLTLDQLHYCEQQRQLYFMDYPEKLKAKQLELQMRMKNLADKETQQLKDRVDQQQELNVNAIISNIRLYKKEAYDFYKFPTFIDSLIPQEINLLNEKLDVNQYYKGQTLLNYYIHTATEREFSFLLFLLKEQRLAFNVNLTDEDGTTTLEHIFLNNELQMGRYQLYSWLFARGYRLNENDLQWYSKRTEHFSYDIQTDIFLLNCANSLSDRSLSQQVFLNQRLLTIFETARRTEIIGTGLRTWPAFAMNAILSFKRNWKDIEKAFRYYGLWEIILAHDKKGNFKQKANDYQIKMPDQQTNVRELLFDLFPEIYL